MAIAIMLIRVIKLLGLLFVAGNTQAASFSVKPTRIFFKDVHQTVLTVGNAGDKEVFIQTELMTWAQQEGKDVYTSSRDVLVSPPMFKVPAGGEQTVRIRFLGDKSTKVERTYRLFLQEVPQQSKSDQATISATLKMGVPIFIQPEKSDSAQFDWRVMHSAEGATVQVSNTTNSHIQFTALKLSAQSGEVLSDEKVFVYVLPGQIYRWNVKLKKPLPKGKLLLQANSDRDEIKVEIEADFVAVP